MNAQSEYYNESTYFKEAIPRTFSKSSEKFETLQGKRFFFYLDFLLRTFTIHKTAVVREAISLSPLYHLRPLNRHLGISQALLQRAHPDSNRECLVSECKSLTTKQRSLFLNLIDLEILHIHFATAI